MPRGVYDRSHFVQNLSGSKFGKLTVVRQIENHKSYNKRWLCKCECGVETIVFGNSLKSGRTKSCGCFLKERSKERFTTHGELREGERSKLYIIWANMLQRCFRKTHPHYKNYGG